MNGLKKESIVPKSTHTPDCISLEYCQPLLKDAIQVMEWRNNPDTLAMFYHRTPKDIDSFWPEFRNDYFGDIVPPLFALFEGKRIAFLRFCKVAHPVGLSGNCVDVSINIAPSSRGKGLGASILKSAIALLRSYDIESVVAEVREENIASKRVFEKAGYEFLSHDTKLIADTGENVSLNRFVLNFLPDNDNQCHKKPEIEGEGCVLVIGKLTQEKSQPGQNQRQAKL